MMRGLSNTLMKKDFSVWGFLGQEKGHHTILFAEGEVDRESFSFSQDIWGRQEEEFCTVHNHFMELATTRCDDDQQLQKTSYH